MSKASCVFAAQDYNDSKQDYELEWQTLDEVLYRLCREHPRHDDRGAVNAKVNIIGRTYATGIERLVPTSGAQGSSISKVSELFATHHVEIDRWFFHLGRISEPLTIVSIRQILLLHGLLMDLLKRITIDEKSPRSFVSKYLHFHNRAVPIYDSVAAKFLPRLVLLGAIRDFQIRPVKCTDPDYSDYVQRFARLYECTASQSLPVTVRSLDYYLLWKADRVSHRG